MPPRLVPQDCKLIHPLEARNLSSERRGVDAQEFQAGTNPTDDTSILRVLTLNAVGNATTTVLWSSVAGKTYRVQYKDDLNAVDWTELAGDVTATGPTASKLDASAVTPAHRFYRVRVLE